MRRTKTAAADSADSAGPPVLKLGSAVVDVKCPDCSEGGPVPVEIHTSMSSSDTGKRTIRVTLHAKTIDHPECGHGWDGTGEAADPDQLGLDVS